MQIEHASSDDLKV